MNIASILILALATLASSVPATAAPVDQTVPCFRVRDLRNHTVGDGHTMYFDVDGRSVYRAVMSNNCMAGTTSSDTIVLRDRGGIGRVCHKLDLDVGVRGNHCIVDSLTKLTPEEVAALPRRVRP